MKKHRLFNKAADLIQEKGHGKGQYCIPGSTGSASVYDRPEEATCFCMIGAVIYVSEPDFCWDLFRDPEDSPHNLVSRDLGFRDFEEAASWNDRPERIPEDVIGRLRKYAGIFFLKDE